MEVERIRFPDGREVDIHEVIAFLYGLSMSDMEVLDLLRAKGKKISTDELAEALGVTKASISRSVNNLAYKGLILRDKLDEDKKKGRPSYIYWVDKEKLYGKVIEDLQRLVEKVKDELKVKVLVTA
ncbi:MULTISPECIES: MarR family transcriptional regulator [Acidianus]|uniref:TrmB family transcriptional regulator n=1 Tax=Candidatus Acidianus copahuensis TaxID=1160895 RepID=A0A031LL20_9CREN|nr:MULTISPECIES: MarR family transcriptional regulator [Acidianus]EZQ01904.1 TrmB family transcriptional regulator [Candidatus Acidianus copahuensis]NON63508.1 MarR family transcriptional regulator [Acidianus sp. RZ1]